MGFIFHSYYIDIDGDSKQVKHDIFDVVSYFYSFNDHKSFKNWKSHLEHLLCYTSE